MKSGSYLEDIAQFQNLLNNHSNKIFEYALIIKVFA